LAAYKLKLIDEAEQDRMMQEQEGKVPIEKVRARGKKFIVKGNFKKGME
jgi:hypothetical protein